MDLIVQNATQHNLRIKELRIPLHQLVGVSGPSGSGKSSLVVHTIFAESQRRFFSSLSTYQRQFFEKWARPNVEAIHNLGASLLVGQKNVIRNSRATVATTSGVLPLLANVWAYLGQKFCLSCKAPIRVWKTPELYKAWTQGQEELWLGFPLTLATEKKIFQDEIKIFLQQGLSQVCLMSELSQGVFTAHELQDESLLKRICGQEVIFICDRVMGRDLTVDHVDEVIRLAQAWSPRVCVVRPASKHWELFAIQEVCARCGTYYGVLFPDHFSYTSSVGSCPECKGFGAKRVIDLFEIAQHMNPQKSLAEGFFNFLETPRFRRKRDRLLTLAQSHGVPIDQPWRNLTPEQQATFIQGEGAWKGLKHLFDRLEQKKYKMHVRIFLNRFYSERECETCQGTRLIPKSRLVTVLGKSLHEVMQGTLGSLFHWAQSLPDTVHHQVFVRPLQRRLEQLMALGLGYLTLNRKSRTLSGGEVQRLSLIHHIGTGLSDTLYVLDEPSIGLHPRDAQNLIEVCRSLVDQGNHCLVIEHDLGILSQLDNVVELGPGSGREGGVVTWQGAGGAWQQRQLEKKVRFKTLVRPYKPKFKQWVEIKGASGHNLKEISCRIPQNCLVGICGVSGSGKTSLILKTLVPALAQRFGQEIDQPPLPFQEIILPPKGITDVEYISQDLPIRSSRANLLTTTGAFDVIRKYFSSCPEAKQQKLSSGHFSFNSDLGRCPVCKGLGEVVIEMVFMEDLHIPCDECGGQKFQTKVLGVHYRSKTISNILEMTVDELCEFFSEDRKLKFVFSTLKSVGLGYLKAGQGCHTYSGGELQRLKIARIFLHPTQRKMLYVLDEPTTGLHWQEVRQLLFLFGQMIAQGHSVWVIEHHGEVLAACDYLIELGPGGGDQGGRVLFEGTPAVLVQRKTSPTAPYLQERHFHV